MRSIRGCSFPFVVIAIVIMNVSVGVHAFSQPSLDRGTSHGSHLIPTKGTPYELESYVRSYESVLKKVLDSGKTKSKKDTEEDYEAVNSFLFLRNRSVEIHTPSLTLGVSCIEGDREECKASLEESLHTELGLQRERAVAKCGLTPSQLDLAMRSLSYMGDYCAKITSTASASEVLQSYHAIFIGWDKLKELGIVPRKNTISTYLFILSSAAGKENDMAFSDEYKGSSQFEIMGEVANLHDILYQPTENTITLRIKALVSNGEPAAAEELLKLFPIIEKNKKKMNKNKNSGELKLRTCLPILEFYCKRGNISGALKFYKVMRGCPAVYFEGETYEMIICAIAKKGFFREDSLPIHDACELGYSPGFGIKLFDQILSDTADDILELTVSSAVQIRNALVVGFRGLDASKNLWKVPPDCRLAPVFEEADENELVACRVTINNDSALCPRTNAKLRLIMLDKEERKRVHDGLIDMANSDFEVYNLKLAAKKQNPKVEQFEEGFSGKELAKFTTWLE